MPFSQIPKHAICRDFQKPRHGKQCIIQFYFISIFDYEHNHVFSYRRTHVDSNQNRRILAAPSGNKEIDEDYQKLFDDYRADLRRIGYGLDITNPTLLRQIGEMKNRVITVEF